MLESQYIIYLGLGNKFAKSKFLDLPPGCSFDGLLLYSVLYYQTCADGGAVVSTIVVYTV